MSYLEDKKHSDAFNRRLQAFRLAHRPFPLLKLPSELRLLIYEPLIQAGDLGILRASKLVNQEAAPLLSKVGRLRATISRPSRESNSNSSRMSIALAAKLNRFGSLILTAPDYIQHLEIRLDIGPQFKANTNLISCFTGWSIFRKTCKITVMFGIVGLIIVDQGKMEPYHVIGGLIGFQVLTLGLEYHPNSSFERAWLATFRVPPPMAVQPHRGASLLARDFGDIDDVLKETLGPSDLDWSAIAYHMRFRPRAFNERRILASQ